MWDDRVQSLSYDVDDAEAAWFAAADKNAVTASWEMCENALLCAASEFDYLGSGAYRTTYDIGGGLVLKIPNTSGIRSNLVEAYAREWFPQLPLADCVLVEYKGVPAILMEKLESLEQTDEDEDGGESQPDVVFPHWSGIDKRQVGWDRAGRMKAFDYGLPIDVEHILNTYKEGE